MNEKAIRGDRRLTRAEYFVRVWQRCGGFETREALIQGVYKISEGSTGGRLRPGSVEKAIEYHAFTSELLPKFR
jgi:hypothetical protein